MQKTLYKRSKNGKIQQWTIETGQIDKTLLGQFRTIEGYVDGKLTSTEWTVCRPKNITNSKKTTSIEQAEKEVLAKIKKQLDKGWTEDIDKIDQAAVKISPMLARKWKDYKDWMLKQEVIASQPKLDGIRCVATKDGLFTRNGKQIVAAPHIWKQVQLILEGMPESAKIDGELYNHELKEDFNTITSLVRKQKVTEEDLQKSEQLLQYHVYDMDYPDQSFASRYVALTTLIAQEHDFNRCLGIEIVETDFFNLRDSDSEYRFDNTDLDRLYQQYLQNGYEGQMIRAAGSMYENSRSKSLLKRKEFQDEEFIIEDIEEGIGNRSGMMGRIKFDGFHANARGTHEYFKELFVNKPNYIGKKATVRFQNWTPDGKPRFPVVIGIRDYE